MSGYLKQTTILYVEDDKDVRDAYKRTLRRFFKEVFIASNGAEGLELYKRYRPDIVMSDIKMPKKNGIEMAKEIKNNFQPDKLIELFYKLQENLNVFTEILTDFLLMLLFFLEKHPPQIPFHRIL